MALAAAEHAGLSPSSTVLIAGAGYIGQFLILDNLERVWKVRGAGGLGTSVGGVSVGPACTLCLSNCHRTAWQKAAGHCFQLPPCSLQVGYTYLDDPAYTLWKEHPDVQAFEVRRRWCELGSGRRCRRCNELQSPCATGCASLMHDAEANAMLFHLPQVDFATGRGLQECMDKLGPLAR